MAGAIGTRTGNEAYGRVIWKFLPSTNYIYLWGNAKQWLNDYHAEHFYKVRV